MIDFFAAHPLILGIFIGAGLIGGPLSIIGWCVGYDHAMRKIVEWMRPKKREDAIGDMPTLPPSRDRRFSSVEHRGWLS